MASSIKKGVAMGRGGSPTCAPKMGGPAVPIDPSLDDDDGPDDWVVEQMLHALSHAEEAAEFIDGDASPYEAAMAWSNIAAAWGSLL